VSLDEAAETRADPRNRDEFAPKNHDTEANREPVSPDKYGALIKRFDERARRLRIQANLFLAIIIVILGAGTAAFIFANYIADLNLRPKTAEAQYMAAVAA
jgi:hypothetical protein